MKFLRRQSDAIACGVAFRGDPRIIRGDPLEPIWTVGGRIRTSSATLVRIHPLVLVVVLMLIVLALVLAST